MARTLLAVLSLVVPLLVASAAYAGDPIKPNHTVTKPVVIMVRVPITVFVQAEPVVAGQAKSTKPDQPQPQPKTFKVPLPTPKSNLEPGGQLGKPRSENYADGG